MPEHGINALEKCDVWTVNAAALSDQNLYNRLESTGQKTGHRLRVLTGAIAGLDGVSALSVSGNAKIFASVDLAPDPEGRKTIFEGSIREAASLFPDDVNVAYATGLASSAIEEGRVCVTQPAEGEERSIGLKAESEFGSLEMKTIPGVIPPKGIHMVAACIIAALRNEDKVIWVG